MVGPGRSDVTSTSVEVRDERVAGVRCRRYRHLLDSAGPTSSHARPAPVLVWAHGGGFFAGGLDQAESHAVGVGLADRGITVVSVDYGLAPLPGVPWVRQAHGRPRERFPRGRDDVRAVLDAVRGTTTGPVLVGGASAGACLAATAALEAGRTGESPDGLVLCYGIFHRRPPRSFAVERRVRGHRRVTHAPVLLPVMTRNYAGSGLTGSAAFPSEQDLTSLPPTLVVHADRDTMRPSGEHFAAELERAGVTVTQRMPTDSRHAFLNTPHLAVFDAVLDDVAAWVRSNGSRSS